MGVGGNGCMDMVNMVGWGGVVLAGMFNLLSAVF